MKTCLCCGERFTPKPKAYTVRYCSPRCKTRAYAERHRKDDKHRLRKKAARKRSYAQTKAHPDRMVKHRAGSRNYRKVTREWLAAYKLQRGCADCGTKVHHAALQLDHEGVKSVAITDARSSIKRLQAEIENGKCVVRCANCHAVKTWYRRHNAKTTHN